MKAEELSRTSLIANDSKSVTTEEQRQEWELLTSFSIGGTQIMLSGFSPSSEINIDAYISRCRM